MKKLLLSVFLCVVATISHAQKPQQKEIIVSGKVIDQETKGALEYATISFFNKKLNKIVTGGITDAKGNFKIPVTTGVYDVSIEFISFKTITLKDKRLTKNESLGTVSLSVDTETLDAVEVIAERTTVEIKLDKKIYNVGKDLTVRGGTVSDVLDNVPSVSVDVEGNVSLRGNENVRILINGKPSGLVGLNSTDALRQLPAESIQKVEVITSPSARYDAEGTAGILNIILRRSKLQGLNGAVTVNTGYPLQAGVSGNINYRTGDVNFFNTTGYSYREVPGNSFTEREFLENNAENRLLREDRTFDRVRKGLNTNLGAEWYINDSASLTTSVFYRDSNNESLTTNIQSGTFNAIRKDDELEDDKTIQYSLNFDKQFKGNSQHKLTFDFQYEKSNETESSLINQNSEILERVVTDEDQNRLLLQTDYVQPIGANGQFELGYRGQFQDLKTDYLVENAEDDNTFSINADLTNGLDFRQDINAFYTQYGNKIGEKFSYLLGLRYENTRITIEQLSNSNLLQEFEVDRFSKKEYNQLFPTVNLGYAISEKESFQLGYNRRIRRPRSFFINPFPSRSSATSIFQGNPDLDPTTTDAFDLGYLNRFGKLTLNTSVYYQRSKNNFEFVERATDLYYIFNTNETINADNPNLEAILQDDDLTVVPVTKTGPINLSTNDRYGFEFTLSYRPSRKWNVNGNFNLFQSIKEGSFLNQDFGAKNLSWFARINNKYTLPAKIDWQTRMMYRGPSETAQSKSKGMFSVSMAFSKDLFKDKASLALNISDLFNTRKRIRNTFTESFNSYSEFQWRQRSINLSFTYRFNQKKKRQRGNRSQGGGEDFGFEG